MHVNINTNNALEGCFY